MTYLSYSGWKCRETCDAQYWHSYVNKTRLKTPDNSVNSLYGSTVGIVFEEFYRDKIYKRADYLSVLKKRALPVLNSVISDAVRRGRRVLWSDPKSNYPEEKGLSEPEASARGRQELLSDAYKAIEEGVRTIRSNRLVGPFMAAEMKLDQHFGPHIIGGRADFVIQRVAPHGDLVIVDGKGSRHRDKYVDGKPRKKGEPIEGVQLKWYAMLYRDKFGKPPDALAYLFWRYAEEEAIDWVPFSEGDLDLLKHEIMSTLDLITRNVSAWSRESSVQAKQELREELFPARPGFHCTLCAYAEVCEEGKTYTSRIGARHKPKVVLPEGVTEFSLGLDD